MTPVRSCGTTGVARFVADHTYDILTYTRQYLDFTKIEEHTFDIHDIAHGLSNVCRYAGQVPTFYSVAQHSVLVSYHVPREHALAGLLHDATEAYMCDIPKPLKRLLPEYKKIEDRMQREIFRQFGLDPEMPEAVHHSDLVLLGGEKRDLWGSKDSWTLLHGIEPYPGVVSPMRSDVAKSFFMHRFAELVKEHEAQL